MKGGELSKVALWMITMVLLVTAIWFGIRKVGDDPVVLESYQVSPEISSEVRQALANALWRGDKEAPLGQVTLMPNGQLLVTAPATVQRGVARIIDDIAAIKPAPTPTIGFDLWIVTGTPAGSTQRGATAQGEALPEIEPALAAIREAKGAQTFELLEKLTISTRSGQDDSSIRGAAAQMKVRSSLRKGADGQPLVAAKLQLAIFGQGVMSQLEAQSEMRPGELLVVGQSAYGTVTSPKSDRQLYYIVRASL
jgi:hypothetical protein